jgi:hypothetical protein
MKSWNKSLVGDWRNTETYSSSLTPKRETQFD